MKFPEMHPDVVAIASSLAHVAHWRVPRMDGSYFVGHCFRVQDRAMDFARAAGFDENGVLLAGAVAMLHDVVEDTKCPAEFIRSKFGNDVADAVQLLTRSKTLRVKAEAARIYNHAIATSNNPVVGVVKLADILDNAHGALSLRAVWRDKHGEGSAEHTRALDFGRKWGAKAQGSLAAVDTLLTGLGLRAALEALGVRA